MLLPRSAELTRSELADAYGWPTDRWIRACMVVTGDGSFVGPDGLSGSISSATDREVFNACRALADVYLVGAQTVLAEKYRPAKSDPRWRDKRLSGGQSAAPRMAIVSRRCDLNWRDPSFRGSDEPPLVITSARSDPALRDQATAAGCEVAIAGTEWLEPADILTTLAERRLTRITCEGGPMLLRELIRADLIDELDLTLSPALSAAPAPERTGVAVLHRMQLAQLIEDAGFLFTRYLRQDPGSAGALDRALAGATG